jgi:hypothetical protein
MTLIHPSTRRRIVQSTTTVIGTITVRNIGCSQNAKPARTPKVTSSRRDGSDRSSTTVAVRKASVTTNMPDAYAG